MKTVADHHCAELCRTSEDLTPEDKAAELLPIAVQQLYVLIRQGKSEEAESVLEEISVNEYASCPKLITAIEAHCCTVSLNSPPRESP